MNFFPSDSSVKPIFNIYILTLDMEQQFSSVQSLSVSESLRPHESQHARPPCPSPSPGVHSDSRPSSQWCHPAISSSVIPFSSYPQSLPASESFPMSQLFAWGGQSTGVSALASFLPKKSQGSSPSEWTGWISLQSKGLSRVFSNTTVQKYQFFGAQLSSQSNSHIHAWPLEKPWPSLDGSLLNLSHPKILGNHFGKTNISDSIGFEGAEQRTTGQYVIEMLKNSTKLINKYLF